MTWGSAQDQLLSLLGGGRAPCLGSWTFPPASSSLTSLWRPLSGQDVREQGKSWTVSSPAADQVRCSACFCRRKNRVPLSLASLQRSGFRALVPALCKWGTFVSPQLRPGLAAAREGAGGILPYSGGRGTNSTASPLNRGSAVLEHFFCFFSRPSFPGLLDLWSWESLGSRSRLQMRLRAGLAVPLGVWGLWHLHGINPQATTCFSSSM